MLFQFVLPIFFGNVAVLAAPVPLYGQCGGSGLFGMSGPRSWLDWVQWFYQAQPTNKPQSANKPQSVDKPQSTKSQSANKPQSVNKPQAAKPQSANKPWLTPREYRRLHRLHREKDLRSSFNDSPGLFTTAASQNLYDGQGSSGSYCGTGCGKCYNVTNLGYIAAPGQGDCTGAGQSITVMVTNLCPAAGNQQWCAQPTNRYNYPAHFDIMQASSSAGGPQGWSKCLSRVNS
ncbi:MAG: hypothetical protein L6R41_006380 [Letrouitia leprolyta]|nr:MAG: hypothetical protein L6R41_006380 [Letrouitia leprolyta]